MENFIEYKSTLTDEEKKLLSDFRLLSDRQKSDVLWGIEYWKTINNRHNIVCSNP